MEQLIENVRKYPCLWKVDTEEYKNNEIKEAAWRNIIIDCDISDGMYLLNFYIRYQYNKQKYFPI